MTRAFADRRRIHLAKTLNSSQAEEIGLRALGGRSTHPLWRLPAWRLRVVATDVDDEAGVAAIWITRGRRKTSAVSYNCLYKKDGVQWRPVGVGSRSGPSDLMTDRPSHRTSGPASVLVRGGGSGSRVRSGGSASPDFTDDQAGTRRGQSTGFGWVVCEEYSVSSEVDKLQVGSRRIIVPSHGRVIVVWWSPSGPEPSRRPRIVALDSGGAVLTELRTGEFVDTLTIDASDRSGEAS